MENLILAILIYVLIVAAAYSPKRCTTEPADYSDLKSDSQPETQPAIAVQPKTITEPMEVSTFKNSKPAAKTTVKPLEKMTIRELYVAASIAKVKGYKRLTKAELIACLS